MNDTGTFSTVKCDRCDTCGKRDVGLEHYHLGCPILFFCRGCAHNFEAEASRFLLSALLPGLFEASEEAA